MLATARVPVLEGNLLHLHDAIRRARPDVQVTLLLEPYSYGFIGKIRYLGRLLRGMVLLRTSRWFIVDNAYLPIHVLPHRRGTTVIQVWHAVGALKRFGWDSLRPVAEPERRFLHRNYDWVVCTAERSREPWARAFRIDPARVLPLGTPRLDALTGPGASPEALASARVSVEARFPALAGRRVVLVAPTFRGRGIGKHAGPAIDAVALRAALPPDHLLVLKTHPNLDPGATPDDGYDLVIDHTVDLNEVLVAADLLVTDDSSSIFEWALLRRPLVLVVPDLEAYEADPGLSLDYRAGMIGRQVHDLAELAEAIQAATVDEAAWDAFITAHLGLTDGHASDRFVERFLGRTGGGATLPRDVRHE